MVAQLMSQPAVTIQTTLPRSYVWFMLWQPGTLLALAFGTLVTSTISLWLGLAFFAIAIATVWISTRLETVRRWIGAERADKRRLQRRRAWLAELEDASAEDRETFETILELTEAIEREHATVVSHFELVKLLECYVELAREHTAYRRFLSSRNDDHVGATESERIRVLIGRRAEHMGECVRNAETLREQLSAISEFVQLVAQEALAPHGDSPVAQQVEALLHDGEELRDALRTLYLKESETQHAMRAQNLRL